MAKKKGRPQKDGKEVTWTQTEVENQSTGEGDPPVTQSTDLPPQPSGGGFDRQNVAMMKGTPSYVAVISNATPNRDSASDKRGKRLSWADQAEKEASTQA